MHDAIQTTSSLWESMHTMTEKWTEQHLQAVQTGLETIQAAQSYWAGVYRYQADFFVPFMKAVGYFWKVESKRIPENSGLQNWKDFSELTQFNADILHQAMLSSFEAMQDFHLSTAKHGVSACLSSLAHPNGHELLHWLRQQAQVVNSVAHEYPQAIRDIADEYGFHFERGGYEKVAETDRFILYQVLPTESDVQVRESGKPILIVHPYVLGADILSFLPGENKSYVHCFANQGVPTYVRILKPIATTPAVQKITIEDDVQDTASFCQAIYARHNRPLTLNGYCQGGLITTINILTGALDGLVDTHITCVAPIDGSRSQGFTWFLGNLPDRFNRLEYGTKTLPNGNQVADGDLMAWVYKIKSISDEAPLVTMYRDLAFWRALSKKGASISKTALALNYWLTYQRHDLPMQITKLSFDSYNTPIASDGTMPFKVGGKSLNLSAFKEKNIPWLICYGESDSLVEKASALAPLDFVDAEVAPFPKGHVAIATSWSLPTSECALHECFGPQNQYRGPVRFHMDMEQSQEPSHKTNQSAPSSQQEQKNESQA